MRCDVPNCTRHNTEPAPRLVFGLTWGRLVAIVALCALMSVVVTAAAIALAVWWWV